MTDQTEATMRRRIGIAAASVYIGSVILANWLTTRYGLIPVGFGQMATAGTFAAGGALVVRDLVQDALGRAGVVALIVVAGVVSFAVANPAIAVASSAAFLISEALDMLAYTPLRNRARFGDNRWRAAVTAGAVLGAVADTFVFLAIAFGIAAVRPALAGQLVGKLEVVVAFILVGSVSRALLRESLDTQRA